MTRAPALPPQERRAAIIEATLPLLHSHGTAVTTRQIAEAAGIAEGTIFRAFADKDALLQAVLERAIDPAPVDAEIGAIDRDLPLEDRLAAAVRILRDHTTVVWQLVAALGPGAKSRLIQPKSPSHLRSLVDLIQPDARRLRVNPRAAAQLLRGLTLAGSHPALVTDKQLSPKEIVAVLLDGIRRTSG